VLFGTTAMRHMPRLGRLALLGFLSVSAAYQCAPRMEIGAAGVLSSLTYAGFYGPEEGYRWSSGSSTILLPDPGPGQEVHFEVTLSGWRPRRLEPPSVVLEMGSSSTTARLSRDEETVSLDATTGGVWDSSARVLLRSDSFVPGPQDPRALGVRVSSVRLLPNGPFVSPRRPPLREPVLATIALLLLATLLVRIGVSDGRAFLASEVLALLTAAAYVAGRPWAVLGCGPALLAIGAAHLVVLLAPRASRRALSFVGEVGGSLVSGLCGLRVFPTCALVALGAAGVWVAYSAQPRLDIEIGSGREVGIARGFGGFEGASGVRFREPGPGAVLDLRDFGGGAEWRLALTASRPGRVGPVVVARWPGGTLTTSVDERWSPSSSFATPSGVWRSGLVLAFPSAPGLRISRVQVDRGRSRPSVRILLLTIGAALLAGIAAGALGLPPPAAHVALGLFLGGEAFVLLKDPLVAIPFVGTAAAVMGLSCVFAAFLGAGRRTLAPRGLLLPPPKALAAASLGFAGWLLATSYPLYRGGHFVFHSSIAEEIWKGRFLIYYLPYPGSMLSRQAQWGDIVVPHPCLYHILVSPLAALPHALFYFAEKCVLALMLASITLAAGWIGTRAGGGVTGTYAAVVAAGLVPTYQLLGLGHLMTILGVFALSVTLSALISDFVSLQERGHFWTQVALLTFCFLSYTAALLFLVCVIAWSLPWLLRQFPGPCQALLKAFLLASAFAFALYYVNWAWPFLKESVPRILQGGVGHPAHHIPLTARVHLLPEKLAYSYGSVLIPIVGLLGLILVPQSSDRVFLLTWGFVLVFFSGVDLYFNLLLKHHYFTQTPIAVGLGLVLARAWRSGPAGRVLATAGTLSILALGLETALAVARGEIP
jgi:hypothetical protein